MKLPGGFCVENMFSGKFEIDGRNSFNMERYKNMVRLFSSCILALVMLMTLAASVFPQSQTGKKMILTLQDAINIAMENNKDILIAKEDINKSNAQVREAYSGVFPQLSLSAQYSRNVELPVLFIPPNSPFNPSNQTQTIALGANNNYNATLSLHQTLFDPRLGAAIQIARRYKKYSTLGSRVTREEVTLDVKKAFYSVLLMQKLVNVSQQGYDLSKANYENVQKLYDQGAAAEYDLLRSQVQVANTEPVLIQAQNNYELAKSNLKNLLNLDLSTDVEVQGEFRFEEIGREQMEAANRNALNANTTLRQMKIQASILKKNISVEKAAYYPSLSAFGAYQYQTQDNTFNIGNYKWVKTLNVGLQLSFSLFDGFGRKARVDQAYVDLRKLQYSIGKLEEGLNIQIQQAQMNMEEAKKRILAQQKSLDQAQKALQIAETRYKSGVGTQLEVLDTQTALTQTRTNYTRAIYDYLVAKAQWERLVGYGQTGADQD